MVLAAVTLEHLIMALLTMFALKGFGPGCVCKRIMLRPRDSLASAVLN